MDDNFEWDTEKAKKNLQKHKIDFAETPSVFYDEHALSIPDPHPDEDRMALLGKNEEGKILVILYTKREERYRLISARKANGREKNCYREGRI